MLLWIVLYFDIKMTIPLTELPPEITRNDCRILPPLPAPRRRTDALRRPPTPSDDELRGSAAYFPDKYTRRGARPVIQGLSRASDAYILPGDVGQNTLRGGQERALKGVDRVSEEDPRGYIRRSTGTDRVMITVQGWVTLLLVRLSLCIFL